jgi:hypothetical protein
MKIAGVYMSNDNSDNNSDVAKEQWFTVNELAELALPGYPRSARRWHDRAKSSGWKSRQVPSQGRKGMRTEYAPPSEIMTLIEARKGSVALERPPASGPELVKKPAKKGGRAGASPEQSTAEWIILISMDVSDADWLPESFKQDKEARRKFALSVFRLLTLYIGSNEPKWKWILEHKEALQAAGRFIYEMGQMEIDLGEDAVESNDISKPVNKT